jgi:hypothetical protein
VCVCQISGQADSPTTPPSQPNTQTPTPTHASTTPGLVTEFERLCGEKVAEEESVRDQFRASIAQLEREQGELLGRLGVRGVGVLWVCCVWVGWV